LSLLLLLLFSYKLLKGGDVMELNSWGKILLYESGVVIGLLSFELGANKGEGISEWEY
jgi:hypothetical protein